MGYVMVVAALVFAVACGHDSEQGFTSAAVFEFCLTLIFLILSLYFFDRNKPKT